MAESGDGKVEPRRVPLTELVTDGSGGVPEVVEILSERRLLTVDAGAVELAHEALLREWPLLRDWLEEDAYGRRLHRYLTETVRAWHEHKHDAAYLYSGARLARIVHEARDG